MNLINYLKDTKQELGKVTWPDRKKVIGIAVIVLVIVVLVMLYIFLLDNLISFVFGFLEKVI